MKKPNLLRRRRRTSHSSTETITFEDLFEFLSDARRQIDKDHPQRLVLDGGSDEALDNFAAESDKQVDAEDANFDEDFEAHDGNISGSDTSSVRTFSTMATMDNNIGTGRTIDNHFYQPVGRQIERIVAFIMFLTKSNRGPGVRPAIRPTNDDSRDDERSILTTSTATTTDLPGTGRIFDKYVYQVFGKLLEDCAGRIVMGTFLSAAAISGSILELWQEHYIEGHCAECVTGITEWTDAEKVRHAVGHIGKVPPGSFILSAIKELLRRSR